LSKTLILCLGNDILCDDAIGMAVAEKLVNDETVTSKAEVIFAPLAGINLLEFIHERNRVLIIDSIITNNDRPGTVKFIQAGYLTPSNNLINSHQISLPTALKLGQELGYNLTENIDILTIEAGDITTISETMTKEVSDSVDKVIELSKAWLNDLITIESN
jgi:hydrogenase maturation protease